MHRSTPDPRSWSESDAARVGFEQAATAIVVSDITGKWLSANPALRSMIGDRDRPSEASSFGDIVEPADLPTFDDCWSGALASCATASCRVRVRRDDGSHTSATISLTPTFDGETPTAMVASLVATANFAHADPSDRTLGQELAEREGWLRAIFDHSPVEIVIKDLESRIIAISGNVADYFGFTTDDFLGRTTADFLPPDVADQYLEADRQIVETGRAVQQEVVEHLDDGVRYSWSSKFPIFGSNGQVVAICSLTDDITELRHSEQELRRAHDALEHEVQERTAELRQEIEERRRTEDELRAAKEAAEQANLAKARFLSSMSHELRTPMNAILGFTELIHRPPDDPSAAVVNEYADHIGASARHLMHLIEQVLDLSSIEAGHLRVDTAAVDIRSIAEAALRLVARRAASNDITLTTDIPDDLPQVSADPNRLRQVVLNLLSNAVKFNRRGGSVGLSITVDDERLRISVIDTGDGIPADRLGALFHPFERLGLESSAIEGTGIGLSLTKAIVEAMGGAVGVSSEEGVGSVFWIDLPRADTT